jgi:hypothetical protein
MPFQKSPLRALCPPSMFTHSFEILSSSCRSHWTPQHAPDPFPSNCVSHLDVPKPFDQGCIPTRSSLRRSWCIQIGLFNWKIVQESTNMCIMRGHPACDKLNSPRPPLRAAFPRPRPFQWGPQQPQPRLAALARGALAEARCGDTLHEARLVTLVKGTQGVLTVNLSDVVFVELGALCHLDEKREHPAHKTHVAIHEPSHCCTTYACSLPIMQCLQSTLSPTRNWTTDLPNPPSAHLCVCER